MNQIDQKIKSDSNDIFSPANVSLRHFLKDNFVIISDIFHLKSGFCHEDRRFVILTNTHIFLCNCSQTLIFDPNTAIILGICELDFDLKFEIIKQNSSTSQKVIQTKTISYKIIFEKSESNTFSLYSTQEIMIRWKRQLQLKINSKGFKNLFRPIKKIGKGGFASVYLAERLQDKKLVAVKAFSKDSASFQGKSKLAVINEINLMRKTNHPNIMKLYSVQETQNSIYLILQLLEGEQLYNKIQQNTKFTNSQIKHIMLGLLKGIEYLSEKRIMHRDLKPENIMLRDKKSLDVVIVDLGLAAYIDEKQQIYTRCGTPGYVAPQIFNIQDSKIKGNCICDVFSLGLIFHILLMGKSVFSSRTADGILAENKLCAFDLKALSYQSIPSEAYSLLKRMLDKNPLTRITANDALKHPYFSDNTSDSKQLAVVGSQNVRENNFSNKIRQNHCLSKSIYYNFNDSNNLVRNNKRSPNTPVRMVSPSVGRANQSPSQQAHKSRGFSNNKNIQRRYQIY